MPTLTQLRLPSIKDEDLFEDFCRDLWAIIWEDPDAQRNGRRGQAQCGVDVFGLPKNGEGYEGVQAKAIQESLTNSQIQHEIDEAKKFSPPLKRLIIACTSARDARCQEYIRSVNLIHQREKLFKVIIYGWEDIVDISTKSFERSPELLERYFQVTATVSHMTEVIRTEARHLNETVTETSRQIIGDLDLLGKLGVNKQHHEELNYARTLVNQARPDEALRYISECKDRLWSHAEPQIRFRILHYSGCAKYSLGRYPDAAMDFIEAMQYQPDDEISLTYAALGYLHLNDFDTAIITANRALGLNPFSSKLYATLVTARSMGEAVSVEDLENSVPVAIRSNCEVANALSAAALRGEVLDKAEHWGRVAIEDATTLWPELNASLGAILLRKAVGQDQFSPWLFQLTEIRKKIVEEAIQKIDSAWSALLTNDMRIAHGQWLINRAIGKRLVGNIDGACEDLDILNKLDPSNIDWAQKRAYFSIELSDMATARKILLALPDTGDATQLISRACMLSQANENARAEVLLLSVIRSVDARSYPDAYAILVEIAIESKDIDKADIYLSQWRLAIGESIDLCVHESKVARARGESGLADKFLNEAYEQVTPTTHSNELLILANELFECANYRYAATIYERIADLDSDSANTRKLLLSYYHSGQLNKALPLADRIVERYGPHRQASLILAAIYEEIEDIDAARKAIDAYVSSFPNDTPSQLRRLRLCIRQNDLLSVDSFLDNVDVCSGWGLEHRIEVASAMATRGRAMSSLNIAYEARRRYYLVSQAHLFYVQIMASTERIQNSLTEPSEVGTDTAVCVRDADNHDTWYVIEERSDSNPPIELPSNHPLAMRLVGAKMGDQIVLREDEFVKDIVTVVQIQSKYVYAFQDSLNSYQRLFPTEGGLWKMRLDLDNSDNDEQKGFGSFLSTISKRHDHMMEIERLYREGMMTVGMFAKLTGADIQSAWSHLISTETTGLHSATGQLDDLNQAIKLISGDSALVLDPVSMFTLYGLKCRDHLTPKFATFAIAQSTLDLVQNLISRRQMQRGQTYMVVGKEDNQFVKQEVTQETTEEFITYLEDLQLWLQENCTVTPVVVALRIDRGRRHDLDQLIGTVFTDTLLISSMPGYLLYSDDQRLRALAKGEFQIAGVWTQAILEVARAENIITLEQYSDDILRLVCANYRHTHINASILLLAAERAEWRPTRPFTKVTEILTSNLSDEDSAIKVATELLHDIYLKPLMDHQISFLLDEILTKLNTGRRRQSVFQKLLAHVARRFLLMPIQAADLVYKIRIWYGVLVT